MIQGQYKICSNCIMDTSDPRITFDDRGWCGYCRNFHKNILPHWHPDERGEKEIRRIAEKIRQEKKFGKHDCIIGLSGGPDSSYATYVAKEKLGLNPLVYHVDAGWDNQQAVSNIEKIVTGLKLDLFTEVIDWEEMKDLQVAFLKAQIPDQDYPQDMAFFSGLYRFARKNRIKYILTGANYSSECVREPEAWGAYIGIDRALVRDIHGQFGKAPLRSFPIIDVFQYKILYKYLLGMRVIAPLNFVRYVKRDAEQEMHERFGWERFVHKHYESRFTIFYESYWLPRKFGYDKRRAHFSSLILTNQMTRAEALERVARPEVDELTLEQEFEFVASKLDLSVEDLRAIFRGKNRTYADYRNKRWLISLGARTMRSLGLEKRKF